MIDSVFLGVIAGVIAASVFIGVVIAWSHLVGFFRFLRLAWRAYRMAKAGTGSSYVALTRRGVPEVAIFCGVGREAWRVSVRAVEERERGDMRDVVE